jgi:hypothetical protein
MGDRRQIKFIFDNVILWFYTHWNGYSLPLELQNAISFAKERWGDSPYLFRILISRLSQESINETTGCGLAPYEMDSEYLDFVVNINKQTINYPKWENELSFEEFIKLNIHCDNFLN